LGLGRRRVHRRFGPQRIGVHHSQRDLAARFKHLDPSRRFYLGPFRLKPPRTGGLHFVHVMF
jgi:hypothetical protein